MSALQSGLVEKNAGCGVLGSGVRVPETVENTGCLGLRNK